MNLGTRRLAAGLGQDAAGVQLVNLNPEEVAVAVVEEPRGRAIPYCRLLGWGAPEVAATEAESGEE